MVGQNWCQNHHVAISLFCRRANMQQGTCSWNKTRIVPGSKAIHHCAPLSRAWSVLYHKMASSTSRNKHPEVTPCTDQQAPALHAQGQKVEQQERLGCFETRQLDGVARGKHTQLLKLLGVTSSLLGLKARSFRKGIRHPCTAAQAQETVSVVSENSKAQILQF